MTTAPAKITAELLREFEVTIEDIANHNRFSKFRSDVSAAQAKVTDIIHQIADAAATLPKEERQPIFSELSKHTVAFSQAICDTTARFAKSTIERRKTHKMAPANKTFASYDWTK